MALWRLSRDVNTPRLIVRKYGLGILDKKVLARLEHRFYTED